MSFAIKFKQVKSGVNWICGTHPKPLLFDTHKSATAYAQLMKDHGLIASYHVMEVDEDYSPRLKFKNPGKGKIKKKSTSPKPKKSKKKKQRKKPSKKKKKSTKRKRRSPRTVSVFRNRTAKLNVLDRVGYSPRQRKNSRRNRLNHAIQMEGFIETKRSLNTLALKAGDHSQIKKIILSDIRYVDRQSKVLISGGRCHTTPVMRGALSLR